MSKSLEELDRRPVPGYAPYFADSDGNIWGYWARAKRWTKKKTKLDASGYLRVNLSVRGRTIPKQVSLLVCLAFHGCKPTPKHQSRHLNGDRLNNLPTNLAWGTCLENAADRARHGTLLRGENASWSKLSNKDVLAIRRRLVNGERQCNLAREYHVSYQTIFDIKVRRKWKHL